MASEYAPQLAALGLAVLGVVLTWAALRWWTTRPPQPARGGPESAIKLRSQIERTGRIPLAPPGETQLPLALRPGEVVVLRTPCRVRRGSWAARLPSAAELIVTNRRLLCTGRGRLIGLRIQEARLLDWGLSELALTSPARGGLVLHVFTAEAPVIRELLVALRTRDWSVDDGGLALVR